MAGATGGLTSRWRGSQDPGSDRHRCQPLGWASIFARELLITVGYHARGGVDGVLSHTYLPGLRLRVAGELISKSHGRAWAAEVPLLGIVGNDLHEQKLVRNQRCAKDGSDGTRTRDPESRFVRLSLMYR